MPRRPHAVRVVERREGPLDELRVPTSRWVATTGPVPVNVQRQSGREAQGPQGDTLVVTHLIFGPVDPPWRPEDRLQHGNLILRVVDVDPDVASRRHHSETQALLVDAGTG